MPPSRVNVTVPSGLLSKPAVSVSVTSAVQVTVVFTAAGIGVQDSDVEVVRCRKFPNSRPPIA